VRPWDSTTVSGYRWILVSIHSYVLQVFFVVLCLASLAMRGWQVRLAWVAAVLTASIVLTITRSATLQLLVAIGVLLVALPRRPRRRLVLIVGAGAMALVAVADLAVLLNLPLAAMNARVNKLRRRCRPACSVGPGARAWRPLTASVAGSRECRISLRFRAKQPFRTAVDR
jgi:O-antigen ligase